MILRKRGTYLSDNEVQGTFISCTDETIRVVGCIIDLLLYMSYKQFSYLFCNGGDHWMEVTETRLRQEKDNVRILCSKTSDNSILQ